MPISNITNGESGSDTRTSLNQVINKVNDIEAAADVTDAGNVGPAIGGATVITTLGDTDQIPVVQSNVLKSLAYSALKTLLGAIYQAKATILGTLGGLANAAGVLTNNGSGTLSYTATSSGGNTDGSDQDKLVKFGNVGSITAVDRVKVVPYFSGAYYSELEDLGLNLVNASGNSVKLQPPSSTTSCIFRFPSSDVISKTLATEDGNISGTAGGLSSTLVVASGGTGQTSYTDGQLLIGNSTGNTLDKATLTAGSGISITNGAGSVTIAATGAGTGTVTSIAATVPSFLSVSGSPITTSGTLAITLSGTALPVANGGTGITAFGTGIATALGVNIGSAGAPVLYNGDAGTPSALNITNAIGYSSGASVGFSTQAAGLATATTTVVVGGATAPTAGQALIATSSTAATWQGIPWEMIVACSDETTALTTGTAKVTFRMPRAVTLSSVRLNVNTAPTGSVIIVDVKAGGTSIFSTKPQIATSAFTSVGGAVPGVLSTTSIADNAEITINIDQIGSTIAGAGLKVILIGTRA